MFAKEIMPNLASLFTLCVLLLELQYCRMTGWMICDLTSFSTVFQSYQNDGRLIMKGWCNGTPFTVEKISPRAGIELDPLDQ